MCDVREQGADSFIYLFLLLLPEVEFYTHLHYIAPYHRVSSDEFNESQPFFKVQDPQDPDCSERPALSGVSPSTTDQGGLPQVVVAAFSRHKISEDNIKDFGWSHFHH
jgi:hypothetical protein